MTDINIGDVLQVVQTWDAPLASVAQNVWHLLMETGTGANHVAILNAIETQQQAAFGDVEAFISNQWAAVLYELRRWDFTLHRFDGLGSVATGDIVGTGSTDYEPHGVAGYGRVITEAARRQGGTFLPGFLDSAIVAGVLGSGAEAALALYLADFDTDISVTGGVLSWCTFNVDPLSPLYETASVAAGTVIANSLPSYLSKRKPGAGL